ncbi:unnamed protein product, partial [marine sediment metagenome]
MTLCERYNTGEDYQWGSWDGNWSAQTFTIGNTGANVDHRITSVKLRLYRIGSPGTGTVAIYTTDGNGKPDEVTSATVNYNFNNLGTNTSGAWVEFTFSSPVMLSPSTKYAIVISAPNGNYENSIWWKADTESPSYTGGDGYYSSNSGGSWTLAESPAADLMFETYTDLYYKDLNEE